MNLDLKHVKDMIRRLFQDDTSCSMRHSRLKGEETRGSTTRILTVPDEVLRVPPRL